jgi:transcriptional regulator with XRE-family HTH domain
MDQTHSFGYWLRRRRKALDLTQEELARQVNCALETIKKIETDVRRRSRQMAERLAEVLKVAPGERATFIRAARAELAADRIAPAKEPLAGAAPGAPQPSAPLPSGTVTFLFTDIAGSTQLWEQHPAAMPSALAMTRSSAYRSKPTAAMSSRPPATRSAPCSLLPLMRWRRAWPSSERLPAKRGARRACCACAWLCTAAPPKRTTATTPAHRLTVLRAYLRPVMAAKCYSRRRPGSWCATTCR